MRETIAVFGAALLGVSAVTWGGVAHAQQIAPFFGAPNDASAVSHPDVGYGMEDAYRRGMAAPTQAFELKLATGYTQGFGMASPNVGIPQVAGAGIGVNLDLDYRMSPRASIGVAGQYQEFSSERNTAARGTMGNLGITVHGAPLSRADPWLRFGAGYRLLWSVNPFSGGPTVLVHGFELAALNIGYDLRLSEGVAIAPMIGADLTMFLWQSAGGFSRALPSAQLGTFVFAGLQARFDAGPTTATRIASSESSGLRVW
jgi:Autotransporter beta-domain